FGFIGRCKRCSGNFSPSLSQSLTAPLLYSAICDWGRKSGRACSRDRAERLHDSPNGQPKPTVPSSNVQLVGTGELSAFLDEFETRFGLVAHQLIDQLACALV